MATSSPDPTPGPPTGTSTRRSSMFWIVPALTFLVGALLGGVVVWLGNTSDTGTTASPTVSASAGGGASQPSTGAGQSPTTVVIPAECAQISDELAAVQQDLSGVAGSLRSLDANRLAQLVDDLRTRQARISSLVESCRGISVTSPSPTSTSS